jgi:hypothetical protein
MRIYVDMRYTIAVDVDPEMYDVTDRMDLAAACESDPEFYELIPNEPRPFYDSDWWVVTDEDQMIALDDERAFHQISVEFHPSRTENVDSPRRS